MAWSAAARAAAAQARSRGRSDLHIAITSGIKHPLTQASLRSVAAKTLKHNRALGMKIPVELHYKLAAASVRLRKNEMARAMSKLHPSYSRGTNPSKFK